MKKTALASMYEMVERFNRDLLGVPVPHQPTRLSALRKDAAMELLSEELSEFELAVSLEDEVDAMLDLTYIALGRLIEMGVAPLPLFEEVHDRNMAKVRGKLSKRPNNVGHDAIKPEGWTPPDLRPYLTVTKADLDRVRDEKCMKAVAGESVNIRIKTPDVKSFKRMVGSDRGRKKVLVMGYARHGKDTAAEMIAQRYGLKFTSSSMFLAERLMMGEFPSGTYQTVEECFEDRGNHRQKWYEAIRDFNRPDASALGRAIFAEHDIYCGIRSRAEFHAMKNSGVFDVSVWVDAQDRGVPPEAGTSCTVEPWMADYVIDNGGDLEQLDFNVMSLMDRVMS